MERPRNIHPFSCSFLSTTCSAPSAGPGSRACAFEIFCCQKQRRISWQPSPDNVFLPRRRARLALGLLVVSPREPSSSEPVGKADNVRHARRRLSLRRLVSDDGQHVGKAARGRLRPGLEAATVARARRFHVCQVTAGRPRGAKRRKHRSVVSENRFAAKTVRNVPPGQGTLFFA